MFAVLRTSRLRPALINARRFISSVVEQPVDTAQYSFVEEPLGVPAQAGFGYFQGGPGDTLGPGLRYKLEAKLGFGTTSSIWLARDQQENKFVSIKILSGAATQSNFENKLQELEVLKALSSSESQLPSPSDGGAHCVQLLSHFVHPGIEEDGLHLCLVMKLLGPDFWKMRNTLPQNSHFSLPIVKHVLRQVLMGIAHAHAHGIAHTDIKPDNIMVDLDESWTSEAITAWLRDNPPKRHPEERSINKMVSTFVKQALPAPDSGKLGTATFQLADWGHAQFVADQLTDDITPLGLRPPEIILEGDWDTSADVWTYGCIVFTVLTNVPLFNPRKFAPLNASCEDVVLYEMMTFTGQNFTRDFLERCRGSDRFFNSDGKLKKFHVSCSYSLENRIVDLGLGFSGDEISGATSFIRRCLQFDPKNRAGASGLLEDPWLSS